MAKKADMFGIETTEDEVEVEEASDASEDEDEADDDEADYVVHQIIPADGWTAAFGEPDAEGALQAKILSVACFALVEVVDPQSSHRAVRPMVADEVGNIDDVEAFDDFICLIPPGSKPEAVVEYIRKRHAVVTEDA